MKAVRHSILQLIYDFVDAIENTLFEEADIATVDMLEWFDNLYNAVYKILKNSTSRIVNGFLLKDIK